MGKRGFLSWLFLGLLVAAPVFLPTSPALAQDCTDPDGDEGSILYHTDYGAFMGCAATGWIAFHPATVTPPSDPCLVEPLSPGTVCSDGTVYAGNSPIAGTPRMFVTPCDVGMVWNGTECTGARSYQNWNSGDGSGYVDVTDVPNCTSGDDDCFSQDGGDGRAFTAAIVGTDARSNLGGFQYHRAAQYCYCLGKGTGDAHCNPDPTGGAVSFGHSDWYLPSLSELNILYSNRNLINNFDLTGVWYQSSSEYDDVRRWLKNFLSGNRTPQNKDAAYPLRCARR